MQSPSALFPGLSDIAGLIFQDADKAVLFAEITNPKSQMMRQGRQIDFHVHRKRLFHGRNGAERFGCPKSSAPKHGQNYIRIRAHSNLRPMGDKGGIGDMIKKVWVAS